jgi:hypothetical protein
MTPQINSRFLTHFQQIFAPFCALIAEICISLFFLVHASKFAPLLITAYAAETNRIQREFLFNVARATRDEILASRHPRQKTNLSKRGVLSLRAFSSPLQVSLRTEWRGGLGVRFRAANLAIEKESIRCFLSQSSSLKKIEQAKPSPA